MRKIHTIELEGKELNFLLKSADIEAIEDRTKMSMFDFVSELSITRMATLIKQARKFEDSSFGNEEALELIDELVDNGWSIKTIMTDLIAPILVNAGVLTQSDLDKVTKD